MMRRRHITWAARRAARTCPVDLFRAWRTDRDAFRCDADILEPCSACRRIALSYELETMHRMMLGALAKQKHATIQDNWDYKMLWIHCGDCGTAWGLRSACLRYFNASGCSADGLIGEDHNPETHLIPRVMMAVTGEIDYLEVFGTDYDTPDGTCIRDYIHVEDLADAHARALDQLAAGGESIRCNLGTGVGVSVKEIIGAVEEITGKTVPVRYGPRREGDPASLVADPTLAKELLGWVATRKDVREMVRPAWRWVSGPNAGRYPANKSTT
ncbi:MAG: UDP-glucose 4-epimerase [Akkermansiaceae bacterium]|nr:UDP-glucose 4-epimerase [Akkermansiaceae bacterium]